MALVAIMVTIALPYSLGWIRNAQYREGSQIILSMLRDARGMAVSTHREYRAVFTAAPDDPQAPSVIQLQEGNLSFGSGTWTNVGNAQQLPNVVDLRYRSTCVVDVTPQTIVFEPNGSVSVDAVIAGSGADTPGLCLLNGDNSIASLNARKKFLMEMVSPTTGMFKTRKWNSATTSFQ